MTSADNNKQEAVLAHLSRAFIEIPFNRMLGLQLDLIDADHVTMNFTMKEELIGNFLQKILHGGVISSVLDMAGGMVVMSAAVHKNANLPLEDIVTILANCSTIDLQVSYLSPGRGTKFIAKAWLLKSGKQVSFARMELSNQEGTLIATGSGTYLLKSSL